MLYEFTFEVLGSLRIQNYSLLFAKFCSNNYTDSKYTEFFFATFTKWAEE